ncbi:tubulin polyglutamylase complex subunit 1 [Brachyhypopomus gauderio]|uniref:tubulin polyglutamylase complex subunit 1 n=1 Tax=Brachyhypopomus gauderio TaxID=698409 RepID=UPI0040433BDF
MAEKRRSGVGASDAKLGKAESDHEFLAQAGVSALLRNALLKLVEARSEDPIGFLAEHFGNLALETENGTAERGDGRQPDTTHEQRLSRALWHLNLAHHSQRAAFNNNISVAYDLLTQNGSGRQVLGGVPGHLYTETLRCLCSDSGLSMSAAAPLLRRLRCHDYEAVPFELFRQGALTCAVFADYVRKSRCLYAAVASSPEQSADRALCRAVLAALRGALEASHGPDAARYLEASAMISPGELARAMAGAGAVAGQQAGPTMDAREFEDEAAALFVARVRVVS